jgi:hypothetical protein
MRCSLAIVKKEEVPVTFEFKKGSIYRAEDFSI